MPVRAWKFRIEDILEAIEDVIRLTNGMTYSSFCADNKTTKAVLYNMAVIGEAARRVPANITLHHPEVPWREMGDMRNVVIHEYFGVDREILWKTIQQEFPPLLPLLKEILNAEADT